MAELPEGTRLAYTVWDESWWWTVSGNGEHGIQVCATDGGMGCWWEFGVTEVDLGGEPTIKCHVFRDAFAAFSQVPHFFAALAASVRTLADVRAVLDGLGAVDETERETPGRYRRDVRQPACGEVTGSDEDEEGPGECGKPSRFIVARSDGDRSFGINGGTEEACEEHLAQVVAGMVNGDVGVRAVVDIRWDPDPEAREAAARLAEAPGDR